MDHRNDRLAQDTLVAENIFLSIGGRDILRGVTIRAERGKITGLLGRNGAGKTTMLQAIFGTRSFADCDVFFNGAKVKTPYAKDGLINYLPQKPFLPKYLTVKKVAKQFCVSPDEMAAAFPELADDVDKSIGELSGGRERLVSALIILLANTRFTLLDEPFSHIMPLHVDRLMELLNQQKQKKGIIITDHLYRPLLTVSDYLFLMKEGKSLFIRDRQDLVLHGYITQFIDQ